MLRVRRVEIVDVVDDVRATLAADEHDDGGSDVSLVMYDIDDAPRIRLGTTDSEPSLIFYDEDGRPISSSEAPEDPSS